MNNKTYSAIGFRNNEGGFELRNPWFKGSSSPKAITSFEKGAEELVVFEGFFDFLSHQTIHQNKHFFIPDFLVLNSTSFFEKSRAVYGAASIHPLISGQGQVPDKIAASKLYPGASDTKMRADFMKGIMISMNG